jgi:type IX secretion system PorP/SprF family membrane protein
MRSVFKIAIVVATLFFLTYQVVGQDTQYTQYYAAPLYLNPGFTGSGQNHRFILNHRNQWPSLPKSFVNYSFSYDYHLSEVKSGVGLLVSTDIAGSADLRSTNVGFLYAYKVKLAKKWLLSPGLYFGYGRKDINFDKLVFGDQLEFDAKGNVPTQDLSVTQNIGMEAHFDFGAGIVVYGQKFWAGFSAYHLNQPNQSLLGEESQLPMKLSIHSGIRIPLYRGVFKRDRVSSIAPSFVYKKQGEFDQLDLGLHFLYEPIMIGLWYRGIPVQQNVADNVSQDAIALILGMLFHQFDIGYSYDFTISELGPLAGGAHELSLTYRFDVAESRKVKRKDKFIPCPTFHRN